MIEFACEDKWIASEKELRPPTPTRTLGPLHFEDLEPHRFEDLVRQLIYDFRQWRSIEAIGRTGSDEGIDIRGIEVVSEPSYSPAGEGDDEEDDEEVNHTAGETRLWVVQCKRATRIGPQKIRDIVSEFFSYSSVQVPQGYMLVAPCDLSKASRDAFREEMLRHQVEEFYVWGRAEVEDRLYLPKNDHLLFAYFGISLQLRRRSSQSQLRSKLALKRRLVKGLGPINETSMRPVLIRDPSDEAYPHIEDPNEFVKHPRWRYWQFHSHQPPDYVAFVGLKHFAYVDWDAKKWDALEDFDVGIPFERLSGLDTNWWDPKDIGEVRRVYWERNVPEENRAWLTELRLIPYDRILVFDDIGDCYNAGPHLLVDYVSGGEPFEAKRHVRLVSAKPHSPQSLLPEEGTRVSFFPKEVPDERKAHQDEIGRRLQSMG